MAQVESVADGEPHAPMAMSPRADACRADRLAGAPGRRAPGELRGSPPGGSRSASDRPEAGQASAAEIHATASRMSSVGAGGGHQAEHHARDEHN